MTLTDTEKECGERKQEGDDTSMEAQIEPEPRLDSKDGLQLIEASKLEPVADNTNAEPEYITGFKLLLATGIVALASFTMLLDTSIVVTVSHIADCVWILLILQGNSPHHG
jgi:hypothetical protein